MFIEAVVYSILQHLAVSQTRKKQIKKATQNFTMCKKVL